MMHGDQPDWADIERRAEQLRLDAGLGDFGFTEIAAALHSLVIQEVDAYTWSQQFIARMPGAPSLARGAAEQHHRTKLLIRAHHHFVAMAPHQASIIWMVEAGK